MFKCRAPGCAATDFETEDEKLDHERAHLNIRPYRCIFPDCDFEAESYLTEVIRHIHAEHIEQDDDDLTFCGTSLSETIEQECLHVNLDLLDPGLIRFGDEHSKTVLETKEPNLKFITLSLQCPQCSELFLTREELATHLAQSHDSPLLYRWFVSEDFTPVCSDLDESKPWKCDHCPDIIFDTESLLARHYHEYHQFGAFECTFPNCDLVEDSIHEIVQHYDLMHS